MQTTPSLLLLPASRWPGIVAPDKVLPMSQMELNCVLMLNWIVWDRTILKFNCVNKKSYIYTKLNCLKLLSKWLNLAFNDLKRVDISQNKTTNTLSLSKTTSQITISSIQMGLNREWKLVVLLSFKNKNC